MNEGIIKDYILKYKEKYSMPEIKNQLLKAGYVEKDVDKVLAKIDYYDGLKDSNKDFSKVLKSSFTVLLIFGLFILCYFVIDFSSFNLPNFDSKDQVSGITINSISAFGTEDGTIDVLDKIAINLTLGDLASSFDFHNLTIKMKADLEPQFLTFVSENTATIMYYQIELVGKSIKSNQVLDSSDVIMVSFLSRHKILQNQDIEFEFIYNEDSLKKIDLTSPKIMDEAETILYS